jgi:hypothetical protein
MDGDIRERVEAFRREIAEIQTANLEYWQTPMRHFELMNEHARREQRLKEIIDELNSNYPHDGHFA